MSAISERVPVALAAGRALVLAFWAGMTWTIGFVVAPLLFRWLAEPAAAGDIAAQLFRWQAWSSLAIAALYLSVTAAMASRPRLTRTDAWLVAIVVACVLVGYFGLQPVMSATRLDMAAGVEGARSRFGALHAVSGVLYLVQALALAGLVVVTTTRRPTSPAQP
ncbi:hypothetical protein BH10PSE17_BH10PSE17_33610 [soil metagenome]